MYIRFARLALLQAAWPVIMVFSWACGRIGYEASVREQPAADAAAFDVAVARADGAAATDASRSDAVDAPTDAPGGTGLAKGADCDVALEGTVALWDFSGGSTTTVRDIVGGHEGTIAGGVSLVNGPRAACGSALSFDGMQPRILIPEDPAWQLPEGSIDLWIRADGRNAARGIMSRDERGVGAGHFALVLLANGRVVMRQQSPGEGDAVILLCADGSLTPGQWAHVGVNFGPPRAELFIDGKPATTTGSVSLTGAGLGEVTCGLNASQGLAGNNEPWLIGATAHLSSVDRPELSAEGVAIDHVRISRVRRDFAAWF